MVYKFSIINDNNNESIMYLSADNISQLYRRIATTYGISKERVTLLSEYTDSDIDAVVLKKDYVSKPSKSTNKNKEKVSEIMSKLTRRCEPYKSEYIKKHGFKEVPISSSDDLYALVDKYKKVKVYFETGEKRGTKKLYAVVK